MMKIYMLILALCSYTKAYILMPVAYHNKEWKVLVPLNAYAPYSNTWRFFRFNIDKDLADYTSGKLEERDAVTIGTYVEAEQTKEIKFARVNYVETVPVPAKYAHKYKEYAWIPIHELVFAKSFKVTKESNEYDFFEPDKNMFQTIHRILLKELKAFEPPLKNLYDYLQALNSKL